MECIVYRKNSEEEEWEEFDELFVEPIDSNEIQTFPIEMESDETVEPCKCLRFEFGKSTDFYGRIVIYSMEVWGVDGDK